MTNSVQDNLNRIDKGVGAAIRARRIDRKLSQTDIASACGVSFQQVQKYESAMNRVSASRLVQIAEALDTTAGALIDVATEQVQGDDQ